MQLAAGRLQRDYVVLAHGWTVDRQIRAQLYWRRRAHGCVVGVVEAMAIVKPVTLTMLEAVVSKDS